jgi:hypothetical protein
MLHSTIHHLLLAAALHLGADGAPVWARAVTGERVSIAAVATAADGRIAIAGRRAGEVDLGAGAVVPDGPEAFAALLGPDGTGGSGAGFGEGIERPTHVVAAGGAAVVAGRRNDDLGEDDRAARDRAVNRARAAG